MIRLIVSSYEKLMLAALWLMVLGAGAGGYLWNGSLGALLGVAVTFVFAMLFVAPVLILSDLRRTVAQLRHRMESPGRRSAPSVPTLSAGPSANPSPTLVAKTVNPDPKPPARHVLRASK